MGSPSHAGELAAEARLREPIPRSDPAQDEERALVARARAGDAAAFARLVDRHRDRAYGLALRIVRSAADAEEVAQDAFVRVWRALPGFRGESTFGTWLYRIVARRAFDRLAILRGRGRREAPEAAGLGAEAAMAGESSDDRVARERRTRRLERMIAGLPEAQREAVVLYYYEGCSVEQVATRLGMNENTVKTHLSRARSGLRGMWSREGEGEA